LVYFLCLLTFWLLWSLIFDYSWSREYLMSIYLNSQG
jgi:hypothetical protein